MAFALAGSTITQTGTDTDLSGLVGIAGVTLVGDGLYVLDGVVLRVEGTLSWNGMLERIAFANVPVLNGSTLLVPSGGDLTVTCAITRNGETTTQPITVVEGGQMANHGGGTAFIKVQSGGIARLSGVFVADPETGFGTFLDIDGELVLTDATIINRSTEDPVTNNRMSLGTGAVFTSTRSKLVGVSFDLEDATITINSLELEEALEVALVKGSTRYILFNELSSIGAPNNRLRFNTNSEIVCELRDYAPSIENTIAFSNLTTLERTLLKTNTLDFSFQDETGASIDAKVYGVDVDNGARKGSAIGAGVAGFTAIDATQSFVYSDTSTSGAIQFVVYTQIFFAAIGVQDPAVDERGPIDFYFYQYGRAIGTKRPDPITEKTNAIALLPDLLITEATKATVEAYTELDGTNSNQKGYDLEASVLYDEYAGETQTTVTLTNGAFDARALDIVIDATAAQVRSRSGNTITYKASTWTGNITTTGTVTTANGAVISGIITDSNGITYPQLSFTGFPTGNNSNGVPYNSVLAILNTNDSTLFTADASSGSVTQRLSEIGDGVGPFEVWADGVGLVRTIKTTIQVSRIEPFSFDGLFSEFTSENGLAIVGQSPAETGLSYDQANGRFELAAGTYTFLGLAYQKELITSSQAGQSLDTDQVRAIQFVQNDAYKRILLPSPFQVAATESAATSPIITDCAIIRTDGADPFAHGLSTTAAGLSNRPEVRISFQAPSTEVTLGTDAITANTIASDAVTEIQAGLATSADQATILTRTARVDALIEDSSGDRFTAKALEAGPVADVAAIPTNPLLTTDVRLDNLDVAISSRSSHAAPDLSNLDVAVSTRSSHAAPDLTGLSTFNPSTDTVTVGTNNDKTGYSLTQAFPSNFGSLVIDGSGNVTAGNMRGTDGANTVAPDNTSISAILADTGTDIPNAIAAIPTNPLLITDARLSNLDATISSRSSHAAPDLSNLDVAVSTRSSHSAPDLSNLDVAVSTRSSHAAPDLSGLAIESKQDQIIANIGALTTGDASAANQTTLITLVTDLHQFKGLDASNPLSVNTSTNVATVNGKTLTQATSGNTVTTTRS